MANKDEHITGELAHWLDAQYDISKGILGDGSAKSSNAHPLVTKYCEDERYKFEETLITTTCDPRLECLGGPLNQVEFTKSRSSHGVRITLSQGRTHVTLVACMEILFGTERLEGEKAYDINKDIPEFRARAKQAHQLHKVIPDMRVAAERRRLFKSLPHTLYYHVQFEGSVGGLGHGPDPDPLQYPLRIDFSYPPYNRYLAEGATPCAYQLRAMMVAAVPENGRARLRAYIVDPRDGQWYAAERGDQMAEYPKTAVPVPSEEAMRHGTSQDPHGPWRGAVYYYVRDQEIVDLRSPQRTAKLPKSLLAPVPHSADAARLLRERAPPDDRRAPMEGALPCQLVASIADGLRSVEGEAMAGDDGITPADIQQHYAPCGRPLNQVAREERVKERLRTRLGKRPVQAETKVPKEAEPSPDEDSDSDDGAGQERVRERLNLDPITASDFEKPVDPKTAGVVNQMFATCEAMPQVVRDKCNRAQELMDVGDKDAALRLMREIMAMPETDAAMVEGAKAVAEAEARKGAKAARATWPIFTNAHIEQAMKEEVECSDRPYSAPNFDVTTDEYTRTSVIGGNVLGATAQLAEGSMREETHRVTRTTIDVDPAAEGGLEASIRAWRYTMASTGDRAVLFGREMVNNPDTLAIRVMPWAQNFTDIRTIGKHNQEELAIAMESRPGLVEFKYPQTFEMRSHNKPPRQERSSKYRLAGVLFTTCPARPMQPVRSVLSCPFVPQKGAVDGKENPGVEQFSRARENWLQSDDNVLDKRRPPFIVGVLKNAAPLIACNALLKTGLNLSGVVQIADANPNELSLAEGLLAVQLQGLLAMNVPSGLWDSVRQCVLEVAPPPPTWIASLLRTFSAWLREQKHVDDHLAAKVASGAPAQEGEIWAAFHVAAGITKSLRNKDKASFAEVALHYSKSQHQTPPTYPFKSGDMLEAARTAKKGAAMAFGNLCLRDGGAGEWSHVATSTKDALTESQGWLQRITCAGLSDAQFNLMETMCEHLQELLAHQGPEEHLPANATHGEIRELYESQPRIRQLMDALMGLKATNMDCVVWAETVALTLMGRPTPPVWLQRVLSGFRKQMATTNESEERKADRQPPRLHVTRHEAYFASSMGSDQAFGKKQWVAVTDSLSPSEGTRSIVDAPPPAMVGISEDGEERAAVLYYRLEENQAREERFVSEMIRPHYSSFANAQRCHLLEKMASVPVLREELFHVASKTMRSMDASLILAKVAAALCAIQDEETQDLLLDKLSEPEVTPRIVNIVLDAIVAQPKRRSGKAKAKAEAKAPSPPKPTKKEVAKEQRAQERRAAEIQERCKAELEQQVAAAKKAEAEKKVAEDAKREEARKRAEAERIRAEAIALEEAEDAEENAKEAEEMRVQQVRASRADAHLEHAKAQQTKRDPNATGLQRQLAADAKAAEEVEKEARRVARLAEQQSQAQAVQDAAYANGHEAQMAARAAQAVANKARKKANKERERAGAAEQAATATVAAQAEAAARKAAATAAELDALWTGPDAAPTAPALWASAARADIAEAVAVAQEEEDLQKAMALSRLDSPPPAASAQARAEGEQARARAEASVDEARARIARDWAARRTVTTTPTGAGRGGRGGGRGRGRGRGSAAAAAPPAATQADEESLCVVCLVDAPTILCAPCGHQCLCADCAVAVDPVAKGCPYCRAPVVQVIRVLRP